MHTAEGQTILEKWGSAKAGRNKPLLKKKALNEL
jgi:hypothetical protein